MATKDLLVEIETSIKEQNLDTLNKYLLSTDIAGAFNSRLLSYLGDLLKKFPDERKSLLAQCILSCLQHFVESKINPIKWEVLGDHVAKLCEVVFNISATHINDEELIVENVSTFKAILESRNIVANSMLQFTMNTLLTAASDVTSSHAVRIDLLNLISLILSLSTRECRNELIPTKTTFLDGLSNTLPICGDYEMQVAITEVVTRSWFYLKDENVDLFTKFPNVMEMFRSHNFLNLDIECRLFLNVLNNGMGDNQLVYSIPCLVVMIHGVRYKKPNDPTYKEFWVDFNVGSKSISFYHQTSPEEPWELKTIYGSNVEYAKAVESSCKSRSGASVSSIKIEIILNPEEANSDDSKSMKIYARKCKEFEKLEEKGMKEIFQDKYESSVIYEEIKSPTQVEILPAQEQPDSDKSKQKGKETPAKMNSTFDLKGLNGSDCNKSDKICSSPSVRSETDQKLNDSTDNSFSHFVKQLKKQESSNQSTEKVATVILKDISEPNRNGKGGSTVGIQPISDIEKLTPLNSEKMEMSKMDGQIDVPHSEENMFTIPDQLSAKRKFSVKRRRLFSSETNNDRDLVMSSQEDCPVEVPSYKLRARKQLKVEPKLDVDRTKITNSYVTYKEQGKQKNKSNKSRMFIDENVFLYTSDEDDVASPKKELKKLNTNEITQKERFLIASTPHSKYLSDKKLLALNATPEGVDISSIFPSSPLNSNRYATEKDTHFKNTYTRNKAMRLGLKKKNLFNALLFTPDPELEYFPSTYTTLNDKNSNHKGEDRKITSNLDRFLESSPCKTDPMRSVKHVEDKMKLDPPPSNIMDLDEPREIKVPPLVDPVSDVPKKGRGGKKGVVKKKVAKNINKSPKTQTVKIRKPRVKKSLVCSKQSVENKIHHASTVFSPENYKPQDNEGFADLGLALMEKRQFLKDNEVPGTSSANLIFMNKCLSETGTRIGNVLTHTQKEREMYWSTFSFNSHASVTHLQDQVKKLMVVNNNLLQIRSLLDTTIDLQNEVYSQIEKEVNQLEESKHSFLQNLSNVEQTQSSRITSMFVELEKFLKTYGTSLFQGNITKQ